MTLVFKAQSIVTVISGRTVRKRKIKSIFMYFLGASGVSVLLN